jgi:outer membrane lipoprotein SlyB
MGPDAEAGVVAGVFQDEEHAADAVSKLIEAHYDPHHEINVIASHRREHENVPIREDFKFKRNASIGAAVGAVLAGAGVALAGLTFGPLTLVAAGPVVAAMEGAFAGGSIGFALGSLTALEMTEQEAAFHTAHIHDGVVWVGVQVKGERADRARRILTEAGAKHFTS